MVSSPRIGSRMSDGRNWRVYEFGTTARSRWLRQRCWCLFAPRAVCLLRQRCILPRCPGVRPAPASAALVRSCSVKTQRNVLSHGGGFTCATRPLRRERRFAACKSQIAIGARVGHDFGPKLGSTNRRMSKCGVRPRRLGAGSDVRPAHRRSPAGLRHAAADPIVRAS
jgi:hypothetical protein